MLPPELGADMRRREFLSVLGGAAAAWPLAARAQLGPMRRVGVLMPDSAIQRSWLGSFRVGLEKLGWIEGRNLKIDHRWGNGSDFLTMRAEELAASRPDVILAGTIAALSPMKAATSTVPIVFANVADPVINGFAKSLTRPGGNITGFANYENTVCVKWLELL